MNGVSNGDARATNGFIEVSRLVINAGSLATLVGILWTALGSWNTVVAAITKTDVVVAGIQRQVDRLDTTALGTNTDNTRWREDISKRLATIEAELRANTAAIRSNGRQQN